MKQKMIAAGTAMLAALVALGGCGGGEGTGAAGGDGGKQTEQQPQARKIDTTPVTLKLYVSNSSLGDQDIQSLLVEPVRQKYPHITIEAIRQGSGPGTKIAELVAAGQSPDLIYTNNADIRSYQTYDLLQDMTPLLKANQVDLTRFDEAMLASAKSDSGEVYGLPFFAHFSALYYNKQIFDKFGVAYPTDGMTWEDVTELAKKVSRLDAGVEYRGVDFDTIARLAMPLSLTFVDPKTDKASVNNDAWRSVFTLAKEMWSIPHNRPEKLNSFQARNWFMQNQNIAMLPYNNLLNIGIEEAQKQGLNWDLAQYPSFKERPNLYNHVDAQIFAISKSSKHKEQAALVLEVVTSDEVQLQSARKTARMTSLKSSAIKEALGADMPFLQGKNLKSIFKSSSPEAPVFSPYNTLARGSVFNSFQAYMDGKKDLNTALREAEENINKQIEANKIK